MSKTEANLEVEVAGKGTSRANYLNDDEVLIVKEDGKSQLSVFGSSIPAERSLSNKDSSGGLYLWGKDGKSIRGVAASGQVIPVGGRCIRPGDTIEIQLNPGASIEIGIAGTQHTEYQMFDDLGIARAGEILRIKGVGVNVIK